MEKSVAINRPVTISSKVADIAQLAKMRLAMLVVFSAAMAFIMASHGSVNWSQLVLLVVGGFLVTGSANAFNQVIEKNLDKLMDRTFRRPLPDERMSVQEALIIASIMGVAGLSILTIFMNPASGILGFIALVSYVAVYTPLKRITPFAVFVGAIPGAIPPMLGWIAATNEFSLEAWVLFAIQFLWQFPHFWAIAWVMDDDYRKAGFALLPSKGGRDKASAFQAFIYAFSLVAVGLVPFIFKITGPVSAVIIFVAGSIFAWQAYQLYRDCTMKSASRLMFGSFIYLPVVLISMVFDKL